VTSANIQPSLPDKNYQLRNTNHCVKGRIYEWLSEVCHRAQYLDPFLFIIFIYDIDVCVMAKLI